MSYPAALIRAAEGLAEKTLGIMGLGRIGTIVAGYGHAFGMDVIAWGPTLDAERAARSGVEYVAWTMCCSHRIWDITQGRP